VISKLISAQREAERLLTMERALASTGMIPSGIDLSVKRSHCCGDAQIVWRFVALG
jgi:hypothetical protein